MPPNPAEAEARQGVDFLDSIMADYKKEPVNRGALKSLHESIKGKSRSVETKPT